MGYPVPMNSSGSSASDLPPGRFDPDLAYDAARMYYLESINQAEIAERLSVSRPTVSRLVAEAKRLGMVRIEVVPLRDRDESTLPGQLQQALGIESVRIGPTGTADRPGNSLRAELTRSLNACELRPGAIVMVASGRTAYELAHGPLPSLAGIQVIPSVGGVSEPEAWHQSNEITRAFAERTLGRPNFLFAQALPSAAMFESLRQDEEFQRVTSMWAKAAVAIVGVGAPPTSRHSISQAIPVATGSLDRAVGDICLNFYDYTGAAVDFPGSERLVRVPADTLRLIPHTIAVAIGQDKVGSIAAGARAGMFNELITDVATASSLVRA